MTVDSRATPTRELMGAVLLFLLILALIALHKIGHLVLAKTFGLHRRE